MATRVPSITSKAQSRPQQVQASEPDLDDSLPYDGSEPGYDIGSAPKLSAADRAAAMSWKRPAAGDVGDVETQPLPILQRTVTMGRDLSAARTKEYDNGLEGLCVSINAEGNTVAIGCRNSHVLLLDLKDLHTMADHDLSGGKVSAITSIRYRPDVPGGSSNIAVVAQDEQVHTVHMTTGKILNTRKERGNKINVLSLSPGNAELLATGGSDASVRVYDERTGRLHTLLNHGDDVTTTGHSSLIYSIAWKPDDPQVLVSGGWDRTIQIWDLRAKKSVRSIFGPYLCGDALDVRGNTLLSGSWRHATPLQLWDLNTTKLLTNLPFHQPEHEACLLYAAKFGDGHLSNYAFAGGSGKRPCLKMFQATGELQGTLQLGAPLNALATWAPQSRERYVVLGCSDRVSVVELPN